MRVRNVQRLKDGRLDMEMEHPSLGWIPFTASDGSNNPTVRDAWDAAQKQTIAPYSSDADLAAQRATASVSKAKFCLALKRAGILSPADAEVAARGRWPDSFADALNALPSGVDSSDAKIVWAGASDVERLDPVLLAIQQHQGMTDAQIDALFGIGI